MNSVISLHSSKSFIHYFFYYFVTLFFTMFVSALLNFSYGKLCGIQFHNMNMFMYSLIISNSTTCKTIHNASYFFSNTVDNLLLNIFSR